MASDKHDTSMKESEQFKLNFLSLPKEVCDALYAKEITLLELRVFGVIAKYTKAPKGCFVGNALFAEYCDTTIRLIQKALKKLKDKGFVVQEKHKGTAVRYLRAIPTVFIDEKKQKTQGGALTGHGGVSSQGTRSSSKPIKTTTLGNDDLHERTSFGLEAGRPIGTNEFDVNIAHLLFDTVKSYGHARKTGIGRARPSSWALHIRHLRTLDKVSEEDITTALCWYELHIGEEFVPQIFSGASFRKKFSSLWQQASRGTWCVIEIAPDVKKVAKRLCTIGWPKGSREHVPAALQTCVNAYQKWLDDRNAFIERLRSDFHGKTYANRRSLLSFGKYLVTTMPDALTFAKRWLQDVNKQIQNWDDWSGDLQPLLFQESTKRFTAMGRGWAEYYTKAPARWNAFIIAMHKEIPAST